MPLGLFLATRSARHSIYYPQPSILRRWKSLGAVAMLAGWTALAGAQTAPPEPVGTVSPTQSVTVTFTTAGTPSAINVLTQGAPNQDFKFVAGGTCSMSTAYNVGQMCSVLYTFTPFHPGVRLGGVTLISSTGVLLSNTYVTGQGTGPQVTFPHQAVGTVLERRLQRCLRRGCG